VLSFEEYKKICGPEVLKLPEKDIRRTHEILTTLADFCYKSWIEEKARKKLSEIEKKPEDPGSLTQQTFW
jgi:hypothetical protein